MPAPSKTQIDKLGDRLKFGDLREVDLRLLDDYRLSFSESYEFVVGALRNQLNLSPTGRLAKSTPSIVAKLQRESIRLSQIQDIAGCRVVVQGIDEQEKVRQAIENFFDHVHAVDRRDRPSHGYRAIHEIVNHEGHFVEIQIRTFLQHLWAEFSEKLSDRVGTQLKYGVGDSAYLDRLTSFSKLVASYEKLQGTWLRTSARLSRSYQLGNLGEEVQKLINDLKSSERELEIQIISVRQLIEAHLKKAIADYNEEG